VTQDSRLIVVSNRLPVVLRRAAGEWSAQPGAGGLVSALAPVLTRRGGTWIGWPGVAAEDVEGLDFDRTLPPLDYGLVPVPVRRREIDDFYLGFCNGVVWPLFHDLLGHCDFNPRFWRAYLDVNRRFAESAVASTDGTELLWVHDYQLIHVAAFLRQAGDRRRVGFFLHIPFPPLDIFVRLPWRAEILRALLAYDLIGFQTGRDQRNFVDCLRRLLPDIEVVRRGGLTCAHTGEREVQIGTFPIGIDYRGYRDDAQTPRVQAHLEAFRGKIGGATVVLGVDRLDYTKGIPERLRAFEDALERHPALRERVILLQLVVPSREGVPEYQRLKVRIERAVGEINGRFGTPDWVPVHYLYRSVPRADLLALYRLARVALITPLKDGMNLVAKEYCAAQVAGDGVLILSEFAGAAAQFRNGALLVNPYDIEGVADALRAAVEMGDEERRTRMRRLRRRARDEDIFWWVDRYLHAAFDLALADLPGPSEYLPTVDLHHDYDTRPPV
jgi:trehalose 6-phosphate synthase